MLRKCSVFLVLVCCGVLVAGTAMGAALSLGEILGKDEAHALNNYYDTGSEYALLNHTTDSPSARAFLEFEFAGFADGNSFGIYDFTVDNDGTVNITATLEVFAGAASPNNDETAILEWNDDLTTVTTWINNDTSFSAEIDSSFGFYMTTPQNKTWYSHTASNNESDPNAPDHMLMFDTSEYNGGEFHGCNFVIACEDLAGNGGDYNDMIVAIDDVSPAPVPEPATMALFGMGLMGLGFMRRRRDD